ncbi:MAG TPA: hypothetical protein VHF00_05880, partial [Acidimicrobiales bacterium]|nr:hypothetical protein [Acidimicrobiales bacterium]
MPPAATARPRAPVARLVGAGRAVSSVVVPALRGDRSGRRGAQARDRCPRAPGDRRPAGPARPGRRRGEEWCDRTREGRIPASVGETDRTGRA